MATFAARELPGDCLSLDELRRRAEILAHPHLALRGGTEGLEALGSREVGPLLRRITPASWAWISSKRFADLHRAMLPEHLPELGALVETAPQDHLPKLLSTIRLLADLTDEHREVVARALLVTREIALAGDEGREIAPLPPLEMTSPDGLPATFVRLARSAWRLDERIYPQSIWLYEYAERPPYAWLYRWATSLTPGPRDVAFLADVARCDFDAPAEWAHHALDRLDDPAARQALAGIGSDDSDEEDEEDDPEDEDDGAADDEHLERVAADLLAPSRSPVEALRFFANSHPAGLTPERAAQLAEGLRAVERQAGGEIAIERAELAWLEVRDRAGLRELLVHWARSGGDESRAASLVDLALLGDAELLDRMLATWEAWDDEAWCLGMVRDARVRAFLETETGERETAALSALAVFHGLPPELRGVFAETRPDQWAYEPLSRAKAAIVAGDPIAGALVAVQEDVDRERRKLLWAYAPLGATRDPRAIEFLSLARAARHRRVYWPATAGLAMAGDSAARAEFVGFLRDDRIWMLDGFPQERVRTLDGDPELVEFWASRLRSNCCLAWHAAVALDATYPAAPTGGRDPDVVRAWLDRHRGRFVWSRLAEGWLPR